MKFYGAELREMVAHTTSTIELQNEYGRLCTTLSSAQALKLDLDVFEGIGNLKRIRFLRPRTENFELHAGSRTTRRLKGKAGVHIAHPIIREHRPVQQNL